MEGESIPHHTTDDDPHFYDLNQNGANQEITLGQSQNHLKETFDSGNYSENGGGTFGGFTDPEPLTESPLPTVLFSLPPSSPVASPVALLSIGSPRVRRRSNYSQESISEEYLYSPNGWANDPPLASSTPIKKNSSVMSCSPSQTIPHLQSLLQNFNTLYEQKLSEAEAARGTPIDEAPTENSLKVKNTIMTDWVRDLNEQNKVLIETVDEMEKETEEKIQLLQGKVQQSAKMLMNHMKIIEEYERQVQGYIYHRQETEQHLQMIYTEAEELLKKKKCLEEKLEGVESEHSCLVKLITRIRDWGVWDVDGLKLNDKTYKELFDLYPSLPGSEVQTVFTQERAREVRENEKKLHELQIKYHNLEDQQSATEKLASDKQKLITDLQKEQAELHTKISALDAENHEYRRLLKDTQELLTQTLLQSSQRVAATEDNSAELNELVNNLKELKDELYTAREERHSAKMEASILKHEMNQRLSDVTQMKDILGTLVTESELTKEKVQEVMDNQEKLSSMQDQARFYQEKYQDTNKLLTSKSIAIEHLQEQLDRLHGKVSNLESSKSIIPHSVSIPQFLKPVPKSGTIHSPQVPSSARTPLEKYKSKNESPTLGVAARALDKSASALRWSKGHSSTTLDTSVDGSNKTTSGATSEKPSWNDHFCSKKTSTFPILRADVSTPVSLTRLHPPQQPRPRPRPPPSQPSGIPVPVKNKVGDMTKKTEGLTPRSSKTKPRSAEVGKTGGSQRDSVSSPKAKARRQKKSTDEPDTSRTAKISKYFSDRFGLVLGKKSDFEKEKIEEATESEEDRGQGAEKLKLPLLGSIPKEATHIPPYSGSRKLEPATIDHRLPHLVDRVYKNGSKAQLSSRGSNEVKKKKSKSKKRSGRKNDLEKLLDVAVESSKTMIAGHPGEALTVKVRASARHHRGKRTSAAKVGGGRGDEPALLDEKPKPSTTEGNDLRIAGGSSGLTLMANEWKTRGVSSLITGGDERPDWIGDPDQILASLPEQSHELIVQDWISKSKNISSSNLSKPITTEEAAPSPRSGSGKGAGKKGHLKHSQ